MGSFDRIEAVARLMERFPRPWFVAGGWAIDLFVGSVTREHEDLEIGIFRQDQQALRDRFGDWSLCKAGRGAEDGMWVPWKEGEWLALPIHQILLRRANTDPPEFEVFLNEVVDGQWQFRRNLAFTRPVAEVITRSPGGIPIIAPEIQLLYKANGHREKDEHDFATALPRISEAQRAWLRHALEKNHPDDPWIAAFSGGAG